MANLNLNKNRLRSKCKILSTCCISYTTNDPNCINYGHGCECRAMDYDVPPQSYNYDYGKKPCVHLPSQAQSLDDKVSTENTSEQQETNVQFSDDTIQYQLAIGRNLSDPTYGIHKNGNDDLASFMHRPIRIFSKVWAVAEAPDYFFVFNPWELFLNDPKVLNKIETFKLLHGTLRLKFMINGSPFHYGRMFVGVRPSKFDNNNTTIDTTSAQTSIVYRDENAAGVKTLDVQKCLYSQRPHVFLDPSTNQPQEITWPFFAQYNWINLMDPETVNRLGRIEIWELNKLQHSNGATDPVQISCFAWMEDVVFAGLTTAAPSVAQSHNVNDAKTAQKKPKTKAAPVMSGKANKSGNDEHKPNGIISGPATTVATFADYFTEIPFIGKYAKATSMAANAVSGIARLFGFSKPVILTDTIYVRPQNIANLANVIGSDPVQKLTLDPKQELTVDPGTVGLSGEDQMSFGYLAKREAYIDYFNWNTTGTQNTGLLYSIRVNPLVAPIYETGVSETRVWCQTPVSFVTRPFRNWSGSLRFRFQIVASQLHRGRLLFVYEPTAAVAGGVADTNDRFAHIVDITQERDVTFEVNWTQNRAYLDADLDEEVNDWAIEGPIGAMTSGSNNSSNGRLNVYVLNELAAPITTSNVQINVYISAGDSYEVKQPRRDFGARWAYAVKDVPVGPPSTAQSAFGAAAQVTAGENSPEHDTYYTINGSDNHFCPEQSDVYFGEAIVSFRTLMKRYNWHRQLVTTNASLSPTMNQNTFRLWVVPNGPGPEYGSSFPSALTQIENTGPSDIISYNICPMTYIRYCMSAYVGYRGSIRWKYNITDSSQTRTILKVIRNDTPLQQETYTATALTASGFSRALSAQVAFNSVYNPGQLAGGAQTTTSVNPTLEVEFPFYSKYRYAENNEPRFGVSSIEDAAYNVVFDQNCYVGTTAIYDRLVAEEYLNFVLLDTHVATGEDYSLFFFIGAPALFESDVGTVVPQGS